MRLTEFEINAIKNAYAKMAVFMPLDASRYAQLTDDEVEHIDQYLSISCCGQYHGRCCGVYFCIIIKIVEL